MSAVQASAARKPVAVIKRVMIWLLNQLQKIASVLAGRRGMRSPNATQEIAPVPDSSDRHDTLTHSNIDDNTVPPIAKRVSLLSAIPSKESETKESEAQDSEAQESGALEMQGAIATDLNQLATKPTVDTSQELVEDSETHRKLDATVAAISTEEAISFAKPAALSELMASDSFTQVADSDTLWSSPTVDTYDNYQPPSIHDLLPAIEPEDTDSESLESIELEPIEESIYQESEVEAAMPKDSTLSEESQDTFDPQLGMQAVEQATLFSFNIYESDTDESIVEETSDIEGITKTEDAGATEEVNVFPALDSPKEVANLALVSKAEAQSSLDSPPKLDDEEIDEEPSGIHTSEEQLDEKQITEAQTAEERTGTGSSEEQSSEEQIDEAQATEEEVVGEQLDQERSAEGRAEDINRARVSTSEDFSALEPDDELTETPGIEAFDLEASEPVNPWLTAVPVASQKSAQAVSPTELESKPGTVKLLFTIKPGNYHGYITPDDGSKDILFHQKYIDADIFDKIERGMSVVVTFKMMAGKAYATRVDLL